VYGEITRHTKSDLPLTNGACAEPSWRWLTQKEMG
jgi:hypothetical protein